MSPDAHVRSPPVLSKMARPGGRRVDQGQRSERAAGGIHGRARRIGAKGNRGGRIKGVVGCRIIRLLRTFPEAILHNWSIRS